MDSDRRIGDSVRLQDHAEKHLWSLVQKGDQEALGQLYRRYYRILYSYACKISQDVELSKDCVQDLFIDIWNNRDRIEHIQRMRPYLLQSVWNNTIKMMKQTGRQVQWDPEKPYRMEVIFSVEQLTIQHQLDAEQQQKLRTALDELPARQKEILFMIYYEGLSIDEITEITGLQYQSIKNATHRALTRLREILGAVLILLPAAMMGYGYYLCI